MAEASFEEDSSRLSLTLRGYGDNTFGYRERITDCVLKARSMNELGVPEGGPGLVSQAFRFSPREPLG